MVVHSPESLTTLYFGLLEACPRLKEFGRKELQTEPKTSGRHWVEIRSALTSFHLIIIRHHHTTPHHTTLLLFRLPSQLRSESISSAIILLFLLGTPPGSSLQFSFTRAAKAIQTVGVTASTATSWLAPCRAHYAPIPLANPVSRASPCVDYRFSAAQQPRTLTGRGCIDI